MHQPHIKYKLSVRVEYCSYRELISHFNSFETLLDTDLKGGANPTRSDTNLLI